MRPGRYSLSKGFLAAGECQELLASAGERLWETAALYGTDGQKDTVDAGFWNSQRAQVEDKELFGRMDDMVRPHLETLRFTIGSAPAWWNRYGRGVGFREHYDRISSDPNPRILSVVVMLSPYSSYDGGDLVIRGRVVPLSQGDAMTFSALTMHAVDPILSGERSSLVRWYHAR